MIQVPEDTLILELQTDTGMQQATYHKPTVAEVIQRLGPNATPEEQDSAVQANFPPQPITHWSTQPDTLHVPGLPAQPVHADLSALDYKEGFFKGNALLHPEIPFSLPGIAADPLPYRMRADDYVNGILLLSFFLVVWVIAKSKHFLSMRFKDFFYPRREKRSTATGGATPELRGQLFLVFQTCFALSLLFFNYTQNFQTEVFNRISPYILLGLDVGICIAYYVVKVILYNIVNATFFQKQQNEEWQETYMLVTLGEGILLLPLAFLVIYFDLSFDSTKFAFLSIILILKLLLFYKCFCIFFNRVKLFLHLFLYFCTLEITPALLLWRTLVYGNECLVVNI